MALVIETFEDLVHIIETNPEWRRRLKRSLFDIDIEAALTRLEAAIEALVTIQRQQGADITELKGDVSDLKTGMARLDGRVARLDGRVVRLDGRVVRIENDVAVLKGKSYEHDYRLKADAIFGRFIRRGRNRTDDVADRLHEAAAAGTISAQELENVLAADLLWGGRSRLDAEDDVLVVLEASWLAEEADVTRAYQRATTLRRIGFHVVPVVAGAVWDEQALALADLLAVAIATNGQVTPDSWQKALMAPHPRRISHSETIANSGGFMPTPFPGMDPYLERRGLWEEVHTHLIVGIQHFLTPLLRPKYRVAVEHRTYLALLPPDEQLIGLPDLLVTPGHGGSPPGIAMPTLAVAEPIVGELPMPEEIKERYLEVRDVATQEVITVIEILSRSDKLSKEGRAQYKEKRFKILASRTSLVEIDLLRTGQPLEMKLRPNSGESYSDYRIVVSRSWQRPRADLYLFNLRDPIPTFPIPTFPIPLRRGETEPALPLNQIQHELYDQGGYDLAIDYGRPPEPPLDEQDAAWAAAVVSAQSV